MLNQLSLYYKIYQNIKRFIQECFLQKRTMMTAAPISQQEQKDKKKAKRFAFWFHTVLLVAIAIPFLNQTKSESPKYEQVITIDFKEEFKSAAAKSSTKKAALAPTKTVKKPKPVEKPKPKSVKAAPRKPVIKTPEPKAPVLKEAPVVKKAPVPEVVEVEPTPEPVEEVFEEIEETELASESTGTTGKPSEEGEGKVGASDKGDAETDGKADEGDSGLDFSGDGLFTRRVTYRAEIKQLTKEEGKIVVNLCVNQQGRVVYTEFNKEESTIATMSLIRQAMQATQNYRFEKDYTAPRKQCGKMTYIFEIEEE